MKIIYPSWGYNETLYLAWEIVPAPGNQPKNVNLSFPFIFVFFPSSLVLIIIIAPLEPIPSDKMLIYVQVTQREY